MSQHHPELRTMLDSEMNGLGDYTKLGPLQFFSICDEQDARAMPEDRIISRRHL